MSIFTLFVKAQQNYTFKLSGINSVSDSKMPTDIMRKLFLINPFFNDSTSTFIVPDAQFLSESDLTSKMAYYGYIVTDFKEPEIIEKLEEK